MLALALSLHLAVPRPAPPPPPQLHLTDLQLAAPIPAADPHAGTFAPKEVVVGVWTAAVIDGAAVFMAVTGAPWAGINGAGDRPAAGAALLLGAGALHLFVLPTLVAMSESLVGAVPRDGDLPEAILFSGVGRGTALLVLGAFALVGFMPLTIAAAVAYGLFDVIGLPFITSLGLHRRAEAEFPFPDDGLPPPQVPPLPEAPQTQPPQHVERGPGAGGLTFALSL